MLGVGADADEVVQESFVRALERPPADPSRPIGPWLTRVAMNLCRDRLRARRRRGYTGPWLPSPVPDELLPDLETPEARYGARESASFAFLDALEALTPTQRAVVLLRDVLDADLAETAEVLGSTPGAIKVAHHRARAALIRYERGRARPPPPEEAIGRFQRLLLAIGAGDLHAVQRELSPEVVALNDAGGRYLAARRPVIGAEKVARFLVKLTRLTPGLYRYRLAWLNGAPALIAEREDPPRRHAPRWVFLPSFGPDGRISALYTVLMDEKVSGL